MRILALDSSGLVASVAIMEEEQTIAEYTVNYKKTHSQTLHPMLDEIVKMTEMDLNTIDAIAIAGGPGSFTGAEYTVNYKKTHSQTLHPMLDEIVKMTEMDLNTIDAIAIAGGPGSFTGLRIGSATAKGLGLALGKPLIHVPTLEGLACNLYGYSSLICPIMDARRNQVYTGVYRLSEGEFQVVKEQTAIDVALACNLYGYSSLICPIMDARRNQVYTGVYRLSEGEFQVVKEQTAIDVAVLAEQLNALGEAVTFLGDGVPVYREQLEEKLTVPFTFAPANMNRQRAASVGQLNALGEAVTFLGDGVPVYREQLEEKLTVPFTFAPANMNRQRAASVGVRGFQYYREGRIETAAEHQPDYLRVSQAERERAERERAEAGK